MLENASDIIWSLLIIFLIVISVYCSYKYFKYVHKSISSEHKTTFREVIGPLSISLGSIIGTGALIGVLGSIGKLYISDQIYIEAIVGWSFIGALFLIPIAYLEAIVSKVTCMSPKKYIQVFLSKKAAIVYAVFLFLLYSVGFAGFQIQGINSIAVLFSERILNYQVTHIQVFIFIMIPILIFIYFILKSKNNDLFVNALSVLIAIAVILYLVFAFIFMWKTLDYLPVFFQNMLIGMKNPINSIIGIPLGIILAFQRIIQSSSLGIGAYGSASLESDSTPKAAGLIALFSSLITIFIAIFITSYIISYGLNNDIVTIQSSDSVLLLQNYLKTAAAVTGRFGIVVIGIFTLFSGITTLLGSYYYIPLIFNIGKNETINLYLSFVFIATIIAIFGGTIVFGIVNSLLLIVTTLNILALFLYYKKINRNELMLKK